jgi:ATP:ADP antiporter, AAA family
MSETREPTQSTERAGGLERLLGLFAEVRAGEAITALLMMANLFGLLVAYYILKVLREPLILAGGGAEMKSYASAFQAVLLMGFIPLYGWFASKVDRVRLIVGVTIFFMLNLELFFLCSLFKVPYLGFMFFVWLGIYSLAIIAQFWSYANDLYTREAGARLFPLIAIGATAGSPVGSKVASWLFASGVSTSTIFQIPVVILLAHLGLTLVINRRVSAPSEASPKESTEPAIEPLSKEGGFMLVLRNPYILLIALLIVLLNLVNTTGEYILGKSVVAAAKAAVPAGLSGPAATEHMKRFIGGFYGDFFFWVNIASLVIQGLLVSRIVKYTKMTGALLLLPIIALGAYSLIALGAGFVVLRWVKTAENATDYSVMNTAKAMLWLPTSRDEKYKAKQAVDTFFVRIGDLLHAALVFVGTTWLGLSLRSFAWVNVVLIAGWMAVAVLLLRQYRRIAASSPGTSR